MNSPKNSSLLPDVGFSDRTKSPSPRIPNLSKNNFVKSNGADRSIYDVFRRSKHKLYETENK